MSLTLSEKFASMMATVALPTVSDWALLLDDQTLKQQITDELNAVLVSALECLKTSDGMTSGDLRNKLQAGIFPIMKRYPNIGISDSEGSQTIAMFFGLNANPGLYHFCRYYWMES
ncbi:MAG: hypothetical protein RSG77_17025 [Hafnia sp.]